MTMDFDDDAPPDLVEVTGAGEDKETEVPFKVPITIVTGMVPGLVYCSAVPLCRRMGLTVLKDTSGLAKLPC